ncbi:MAG: ATP-dependent zinc metalloprotease FtsH [Ktedonobacteraceae bacterium]|nr:ATP-dependent zinc metalloprotease FtsH [Ktedonobacteraceae bacterium]
MDDKAGRRDRHSWANASPRRRVRIQSYGRSMLKYLQTHKSSFLTGILLLLAVALLFGIFSRLQAPPLNSIPAGETAIDYGTFVRQAEQDHIMAAVIRGDEVFGLLTPTGGNSDPEADYQAWMRYIGINIGSSQSNQAQQPAIDPARAVYMHLPSSDTDLLPLLISHHVRVTTLPVSQTGAWLEMFWRFLPFIFLLFLLLIFFSMRGSKGSALDEHMTRMGKSRARRFERAKEAPLVQSTSRNRWQQGRAVATGKAGDALVSTELVTFADVAGIDEVRSELEEIVAFLRTPERYDRLGARIPRGVLLAGPPGTGKTLLAKAVAGEAGVPFFSMSASEFVEMFVGVGASRVRDLFNRARQSSPCVVFIDELDAVGRKRTARVAGSDERDQTLNQLLVELDGFDTRQAVVVLAATNRVDILDAALLRPGRFDRRVSVSLPDRTGREAILKVHTRKVPLHEDVCLERLSRMTTGMSGADLANLVNEAALIAARLDMEHVNDDCFEQALARVQLGALRPLVMSEHERRIIAYHEGGHALVAYHLPEADNVNRVTILPRGQSLGVTQFVATEDRYNYSRTALMARIAVGLGGRVAEELTLGPQHVTTGAENDLQVVTNLARRMVTRWGMSEQIGVVFADRQEEGGYGLNMRLIDPAELPARSGTLALNAEGNPVPNSADLASHQTFAMSLPSMRNASSTAWNALIDTEVQCILNEGYAMARSLLSTHYGQLTTLAEALMEHEQLDRTQFEALLQ